MVISRVSRDLAEMTQRGWLCFNMFYMLHAQFLLNQHQMSPGIIYLYVLNRIANRLECRCFSKQFTQLLSQGTNANSGMYYIAWNITFQLDSPRKFNVCTACPGWKMFDRSQKSHFSKYWSTVYIFVSTIQSKQPLSTKQRTQQNFALRSVLQRHGHVFPEVEAWKTHLFRFHEKRNSLKQRQFYWPYELSKGICLANTLERDDKLTTYCRCI